MSLVTTDWLEKNLTKVKIFDATWHMPSSKRDAKKEYDCLVYSKKRRYDHNFESFREKLLGLLDDSKISYYEIREVTTDLQ